MAQTTSTMILQLVRSTLFFDYTLDWFLNFLDTREDTNTHPKAPPQEKQNAGTNLLLTLNTLLEHAQVMPEKCILSDHIISLIV